MIDNSNKRLLLERRRYLRKNPTFAEKVMWMYLRKKQMLGYSFRRQHPIDYYIIDFYCPKLKLAIEVDGETHNNLEQKEYDKKREEYIKKFGIKFIRITDDELLGNPNKAFKKLEDAIKLIKK